MSGRLWDIYEEKLNKYDFFRDFRAGNLSKTEFKEKMEQNKSEIISMGIGGYDFHRLLRSVSGNIEVDEMLEEFKNQGGFADINYGIRGFENYSAKIKPNYENGRFETAIFPEDELFMYAAAKLTAPKTMFMAGSYFGYWAIWAMEAVKDNGGICTLSDVNPDVMKISEINIRKFGFIENTKLIADDAEKLLLSGDEKIDLLALDATGSSSDPRPTHRGKILYATLLAAARHRLHTGSIIVIHNLERDLTELAPLIVQLDEISSAKAELICFNGLGIYKVK
jgi:predicted O-methyltransferase YrrM